MVFQIFALVYLAYQGRTQADDNVNDVLGSDIGVSMIGLDARYKWMNFSARGQYVLLT